MKKKLFSLVMGFLILSFITANIIFSLKEFGFTTVLNIDLANALADDEGGGRDYYYCYNCWNPYGQETYATTCAYFGYPGCLYIPCGYNQAICQ